MIKHLKKMMALALSLSLCVGALAGCSPPAAKDAAANGADASGSESDIEAGETAASGRKILRFSQKSDPDSLDPQLVNSTVSQVVGSHIFEPLMRTHGGNIELGAAESYEMSEDGITYTFQLRDLDWSDGQPVTAQDYEYGIKRLLNPDTASPYSFIGMIIKNGAAVNSGDMSLDELGVKATDDKTLEIQLEYPATYFLSMLAMASFAPTRADIVEKHGTKFASSADTNVYNGPFIIKEWVNNDRLVLEKNEGYWNKDVVKLDGAEILTVAAESTALAMFESGDLDFVEIPSQLAESYEEKDFYYSGAADYLKLNEANEYLANKNLRQALNFGISRKDFITLATSDVYEASLRFVLPQVHGVNGEYGTEYPYEAYPVEGDVEKAKEYLDTALKELGKSDPSEIELELLTSDSEMDRTNAEVIQAQYQTNLGIKVNIRQVQYKQRLDLESKHEFEMVFSGWMPDYSDPYTYLEQWTSDSPYNHIAYNSDVYDGLIADANQKTNPKERMDLLFEAEKTLLDDAALVPLQMRRIPYMTNPNVENFIHYFVNTQHDFMLADIKE